MEEVEVTLEMLEQLVDLVVVVLGMEELEQVVLHKHLLMDFHQLFKVMLVVPEHQAVINLARCLVVAVVPVEQDRNTNRPASGQNW